MEGQRDVIITHRVTSLSLRLTYLLGPPDPPGKSMGLGLRVQDVGLTVTALVFRFQGWEGHPETGSKMSGRTLGGLGETIKHDFNTHACVLNGL